ncbi:putative phage abortive infection protein [Aquimarina litoralis]|uniref:putative phage abortive infection protein n=1 Tax=Aquimarina litoralis TaxID=584605 RepID=UPI001C5A31BF|nr:putative phage abortive infection protein [Aquimarina litoralis]MBW1294969.1 hypothetical protein [Aquimarina litoralis]
MFTEKTSKILMWIGIAIFFLGIVLFFWNDTLFETNRQIKSDKVAHFGDFVGGLIGSLWALAGVILFYVALREQRADIETNRDVLKTQVEALEKQIEEFELQRQELELTRQVFTEQRDTLKLQQFESTFFSLLNLHHQIVDGIDIDTTKGGSLYDFKKEKDVTLTGRDCFQYFFQEFEEMYASRYDEKNELDRIQKSYIDFYVNHQTDLGHYFRNLYNILKFVHKKNPGDNFFYANLLRAQLSSSELLMLFYNCLSKFGNRKFKPLIEEYHFLQNMPKNPIFEQKDHTNLYNKSAFGKPSLTDN